MPSAKLLTIGAGVAAVAVIAAVLYWKRKDILIAFNPASANNVVYGAANALGGAMLGRTDGSFTVGSGAFDAVDNVWSWITGKPTAGQVAVTPSLPTGGVWTSGYDLEDKNRWNPQALYEIPGVFLP